MPVLLLLREYLAAFAVIFVVFTAMRFFGFLAFSGTRGDLVASMAAEALPSALWALVLVGLRFFRRK